MDFMSCKMAATASAAETDAHAHVLLLSPQWKYQLKCKYGMITTLQCYILGTMV